jgi:hypothetical protein
MTIPIYNDFSGLRRYLMRSRISIAAAAIYWTCALICKHHTCIFVSKFLTVTIFHRMIAQTSINESYSAVSTLNHWFSWHI